MKVEGEGEQWNWRFCVLLFTVFAGCYFAFLQIFGILFGEELNI